MVHAPHSRPPVISVSLAVETIDAAFNDASELSKREALP